MENKLTPEQLAMDEAYQEAKRQSLITSLTGAAGFRLGWEAAEAYAAKLSQKQHLVELMKMDEEKTGEPCFTEDDVKRLQSLVFWETRIKYLNRKASQYATDRAKKALEKAANSSDSHTFYSDNDKQVYIRRESIINTKNLEL